MSLEELMNVQIVSASKKAENSFDAPLASTVITRQEIIQSGATTIPEVLRLVPGMIVREKTNGNYDVHMRGFDNVQGDQRMNSTDNTFSLVMIDNRVVFSYFQGGTFWETLPIGLEDIEKIEVIRGASSALYGPNAVTGVINIITRKGVDSEKKYHAFVNANGSMYESFSSQFGWMQELGNNVTVGFSGNQQNRGRYEDSYYLTSANQRRYVPYDSLANIRDPFGNSILPGGPDDWYPLPGVALHNYGFNGFARYDNYRNTDVHLALGQQGSLGQFGYMGTGALPTTRESRTRYISLDANASKLHAHFAYTGGTHKLVLGNPDFNYDLAHIDGLLEYDLVVKNLTIRPGISYFSAIYDVSEYVDDNSYVGYFRGSRTLSTLAGQVRMDYKLFQEKLRFIAALRADKYNEYDNIQLSYQLISTYKPSEKQLFRLGYSTANRGAFMLSSYMDYYIPMGPGMNLHIEGDPDLELPVIKTVEAGLRSKWLNNLQTDIEAFYSVTEGYSYNITDSILMVTIPFPPPPVTIALPTHATFQPIDLKAEQIGLSAQINMYLTKIVNMRLFGTFQQTNLTDYAPEIELNPDSLIDKVHEWTPSFYGGASINYNFIEKAYINVSLYSMSEQSLYAFGKTETIPFSVIVNTKLAWKFGENSEIYLNFRNMATNERQFAYSEQIKPWFGGGVAFRL
jgi:iron complex outermembrane receptor protein